MRFFRTKLLVEELARGQLPRRQLAAYLIAWSVWLFVLPGSDPSVKSEESVFGWDALAYYGAMTATVITAYMFCRTEGNWRFVADLLCVAWPETMKFALIALGGGLVFAVCPPHKWIAGAVNALGWALFLAVCFRVVWFMRLLASMRRGTRQAAVRQ